MKTVDDLRDTTRKYVDLALNILDDAWLDGDRSALVTFRNSAVEIQGAILGDKIVITVAPKMPLNVVEYEELHAALGARILREFGTRHDCSRCGDFYTASYRPEKKR